MKLPTPQDLGFPEKFHGGYRPVQEDAIQRLLRSTKRVKATSAPVGSGKSLVYVTVALITGVPTCIVTENRGLQNQLLLDFGGVGMVDIRGRRNYDCPLKPTFTCEDGYAARCPYKGTVSCPSSQAEMRASASSLVVTNYDKWTSARKFGQGMQHFQQVIFDEGHAAPDALARAMQVTLSHHEVEEVLGLDFPTSNREEFIDWKPWIAEARREAEAMMLSLRALVVADPKPTLVRQFTHVRNLCKRLATLSTANPNNWIVDAIKEGYQFDPVRLGRYAEAMLFLRVPSVHILSGTLRPKTLQMLGLGRDSYEFLEYDSEFDAARCPIYYVPTMRVDKNAKDLSLLWLRLDQLAARRTDRNGIVHTISYARRDEILSRSRFAPHMFVNPKGEAPTEIVDAFIAGYPGSLLVSPSVGAGFDFPGKACEWQFVCKIPFPDGRAKIIKARQEDDKEYGAFLAINKLQQIFGRGMRSKGDQCENFIGDMHLDWFLPRYGHLASKTFHRFFRRVDVAPAPPPRL